MKEGGDGQGVKTSVNGSWPLHDSEHGGQDWVSTIIWVNQGVPADYHLNMRLHVKARTLEELRIAVRQALRDLFEERAHVSKEVVKWARSAMAENERIREEVAKKYPEPARIKPRRIL